MAVERDNPLPRGIYWVDVPGPEQAAFRGWLNLHAGPGHVRVLRTRSTEARDEWPAVDWYLFEVQQPVQWDGPGFPSIAEQGEETTPEDTVDRPPPEPGPLEQFEDAVTEGAGKTIGVVAGTAAIGSVIYLLLRRKR